ncbi:hypothetical protein OG998_18980 [Streptomyces albidoflavus]|uniref:hypothetical protein n=1 Tax=Streptomyces albidoflavus TaxID=1886 RepID=UPI00101F724D|nr:hypothetical protein [Streptomyces albidoflavus]RZE61050.1 hypothetical protein C0Q98_11960 [Streptomyces albidoflavus]WTB77259.1 hypothetical protein OG998_18980 [Streptomyces albidoflavus]
MSQNKIVVPGKAEAIVEETAGGEGVWAEDRVAQVLERLASDFVLDNTWRALRVRAAVPGRARGEWAFADSGANASLVGKLTVI